ncbi:Prpf6 [Symbiodinium sp. CCMP2456]|nr:Prpf6 [Symbiodinium sp. CCMP2456]
MGGAHAGASQKELPPGTGIAFEAAGIRYLAMVTATCRAEHDPRYGVAHQIRYVLGQCSREWVELDVERRYLWFRDPRRGVAFRLQGHSLWSRDVLISSLAWSTMPLESERSCIRLCDFLEKEWPRLGLPLPVYTLELGSGTGWLGMSLARNLVAMPARSMTVLTERRGDAMTFLMNNIEFNIAEGLPLEDLRADILDWSDWEGSVDPPESMVTESAKDFDLLLGSDLAYNSCVAAMLVDVLRWFLSQKPQLLVLLAHRLRRQPDVDVAFFQGLLKKGLDYNAVAAEGHHPEDSKELDPLLPDSDWAAESNFGCVVVYQITCADHDQFLVPFSDCLLHSESELWSC